jgi:hypothetical protein
MLLDDVKAKTMEKNHGRRIKGYKEIMNCKLSA